MPFLSIQGGSVIEKQCSDPSCTHMVVGYPLRNENYLASMAAGKWVLHRSYLDACKTAGRFVQVCIHIPVKVCSLVNDLGDPWSSPHRVFSLNDHTWPVRLQLFCEDL